MSHPLPNLLETTLQKLREMVDVNSVMGDPIQTPDGITILPVCKVSYGFGGGGADFSTKNQTKQEYPFGGGTGGGVKMTPVAFLVIKGESVRLLPVGTPAVSAGERVVDLVPDLVDKVTSLIDGRKEKTE